MAADAVRLVPAPAADGYYVHADRLGSPQAMTDDAQQEVWRIDTRPFGEVEALTWTVENNQRFPGQYEDAESGYSYNWFRDYEPALGRYLQSDPIGLMGGVNTFAYVEGNPVGAVDPAGLDPESDQFSRPNPYFNPQYMPGTREWAELQIQGFRALIDALNQAGAWVKGVCFGELDCEEILKGCRKICTDTYVDDRDRLPGMGTDYAGRLRRCIRECMTANGCENF